MDKIVMIDRSTLSRKEEQMLKVIFWSQAKKEAEKRIKDAKYRLNLAKSDKLYFYSVSECEQDLDNLNRLVRFCNERGLIATSNILMR